MHRSQLLSLQKKVISFAVSQYDDAILLGYEDGVVELFQPPSGSSAPPAAATAADSFSQQQFTSIIARNDAGDVGCVNWRPLSTINNSSSSNGNAHSQQQRAFAVGLPNGVVTVWVEPRLVVGSPLKSLWEPHVCRGHVFDVVDVSWSPDGSLLASGGRGGDVIVWEDQGGNSFRQRSVISKKELSGWVYSLRWDPLGRFLVVSSGTDLTIRRAHDVREVAKFTNVGSAASGASASWSPEGTYLCIGHPTTGDLLVVPRTDLRSVLVRFTSSTGSGVCDVRFSPHLYANGEEANREDAVMAVLAADRLTLWATASPREIDGVEFPKGASPRVQQLRWRRDGFRIIVCETAPPTGGDGGGATKSSLVSYDVRPCLERVKMTSLSSSSTSSIALDGVGSKSQLPSNPLQLALEADHARKMASLKTTTSGVAGESTVTTTSNHQPVLTTTFPTTQTETRKDGKRRIKPVTAIVTASSTTNNNLQQNDEDCGTCKYCLDKPRFGGKNSLRQRCANRPPLPARPGMKRSLSSASVNGNGGLARFKYGGEGGEEEGECVGACLPSWNDDARVVTNDTTRRRCSRGRLSEGGGGGGGRRRGGAQGARGDGGGGR